MSEANRRNERLGRRLGQNEADAMLRELPESLFPTVDALLDAGDALPLAEEPPPSLRRELRQIFAEHHRAGTDDIASSLSDSDVVREPDYDSRRAAALAGVRGLASGTTLTYGLPDGEVVVDIETTDDVCRVRVIALGLDHAAIAQLRFELRLQHGGLHAHAEGERETVFSSVPMGVHTLVVSVASIDHRFRLDLAVG